MKVVLKKKNLSNLEFINTADDLYNSLQQQKLSGLPLLQDQQSILSVLILSYARPCSLFLRTTGDSFARLTKAWVILRLSGHILIGSEECISPTDTACIMLSHIRSLVHSFNSNLKIATFLNPINSHSIRLSDIIALRTGDIMIMAPRWLLKIRNKNVPFTIESQVQTILETLIQQLH